MINATIYQQLHQQYGHTFGNELIIAAVDHIFEHAMDCDAGTSGNDMVRDLIDGCVSREVMQEAIRTVVSYEMSNMVDQMRGVVTDIDKIMSEDNMGDYTKCKTLHVALEIAGAL